LFVGLATALKLHRSEYEHICVARF